MAGLGVLPVQTDQTVGAGMGFSAGYHTCFPLFFVSSQGFP